MVRIVSSGVKLSDHTIPPKPALSAGFGSPMMEAMMGTGCAKRQPVILKQKAVAKPAIKCAEMAGGAAVDCAAVCCCCPCGIVSLIVLATVRVPAGICRRVIRAQRMRRKGVVMKKEEVVLLERRTLSPGAATMYAGMASVMEEEEGSDEEGWPGSSPNDEMAEFEREMWAKFYHAGFWRSPSQRSEC